MNDENSEEATLFDVAMDTMDAVERSIFQRLPHEDLVDLAIQYSRGLTQADLDIEKLRVTTLSTAIYIEFLCKALAGEDDVKRDTYIRSLTEKGSILVDGLMDLATPEIMEEYGETFYNLFRVADEKDAG